MVKIVSESSCAANRVKHVFVLGRAPPALNWLSVLSILHCPFSVLLDCHGLKAAREIQARTFVKPRAKKIVGNLFGFLFHPRFPNGLKPGRWRNGTRGFRNELPEKHSL